MAGGQIAVTDDGIEIVYAAANRRPAFDMSWPWTEIHSIGLLAPVYPPDNKRFVYLDISHVSGEFAEVYQADTEGFAEAVAEIARRGGTPVPDLDVIGPDDSVEIWRINLTPDGRQGASPPPA